MGMRFGVTEENKAQINLDPYGNVSVFNININNVSTMDMDNASTTFHNTLNVENVSVGGSLSVTGSIEGYQETLIAGTNITITGNTISSAGGGGTLPANANFSSVNTSTLNASTIDSSGRVDIGDADGQSEGLVLTGTQPTITLKDTDARSGMIHMNDNNMFFYRGRPIAKLGVKSIVSGLLYYIQIQIEHNLVAI